MQAPLVIRSVYNPSYQTKQANGAHKKQTQKIPGTSEINCLTELILPRKFQLFALQTIKQIDGGTRNPWVQSHAIQRGT